MSYQFKVSKKTVKETKNILTWAIGKADIKQSAMYTAPDENGMSNVVIPADMEVEESIKLIDKESVGTLQIRLQYDHIIFDYNVYVDKKTYMFNIGVPEEFFDELERKDIIEKVYKKDKERVAGYI